MLIVEHVQKFLDLTEIDANKLLFFSSNVLFGRFVNNCKNYLTLMKEEKKTIFVSAKVETFRHLSMFTRSYTWCNV